MEPGNQSSRTLPEALGERGGDPELDGKGVPLPRPDEAFEPGVPGMLRIPLWWADEAPPPDTRLRDEPPSAAWPKTSRQDDETPYGDGGSAYDDEDPTAPPRFAWSFGDDVEEVRARPGLGRGMVLWLALAVISVIGLVAALVFGTGGGKKQPQADEPAPSAPPAAPPSGPPEAYMPRSVALGGFDGRVQVTWQAPERADQVVGFMAIAQSRQGVVLEHQLLPAGQTSAVFASPPMTRDGCIVVATLVRGGSGVTPIRTEPVCL